MTKANKTKIKTYGSVVLRTVVEWSGVRGVRGVSRGSVLRGDVAGGVPGRTTRHCGRWGMERGS